MLKRYEGLLSVIWIWSGCGCGCGLEILKTVVSENVSEKFADEKDHHTEY